MRPGHRMKGRHVFTAKLESDPSGMSHVDVPASVSKAIGRAKAPVEARIGRSEPFRGTFMPAGGGRHRLFVSKATRRAAGVEPGDRVRITSVVDDGRREVPIPPDLREALSDAGVLDAWEGMPPGKRALRDRQNRPRLPRGGSGCRGGRASSRNARAGRALRRRGGSRGCAGRRVQRTRDEKGTVALTTSPPTCRPTDIRGAGVVDCAHPGLALAKRRGIGAGPDAYRSNRSGTATANAACFRARACFPARVAAVSTVRAADGRLTPGGEDRRGEETSADCAKSWVHDAALARKDALTAADRKR